MTKRIVPLRITIFSGLMLLLLIGGMLVGIVLTKNGAITLGDEQESVFYRLLREYDFKYRRILETESPVNRQQELEELDRELGRLEKNAEGVESWLSVLKRRRQLVTDGGSRFAEAYRSASLRAVTAFPYSEPVAAVAAAALVHDTAITAGTETRLREMIPLLASSRFASMRLSLHVLLGDLKNPETAMAAIPLNTGWSPDISARADAESILIDLLLMKILAGDIPGVAVDIQSALSARASPALTRLAAEYFYDFGEPLRSAELFSVLPDEAALSRQADALWLAGYAGNARAIWAMLANAPTGASSSRALYNLALTAPSPEESAALLERLAGQAGAGDTSRRFGLIRFSRLLDAPQALAMLEAESSSGRSGANTGPAAALLDLEILRRRAETGETARIIAETWLLLEQYPATEELYEWAAWYFGKQRFYDESALLQRTALRHNFTGQWLRLHQALLFINDGNISTAEESLRAIPADNDGWAVPANLGRILEARRTPARALESYEKALSAITGTAPAGWEQIASRIQVRVAHCLKSVGKIEESRRALEYALDLNSDNLNARLELSRLE